MASIDLFGMVNESKRNIAKANLKEAKDEELEAILKERGAPPIPAARWSGYLNCYRQNDEFYKTLGAFDVLRERHGLDYACQKAGVNYEHPLEKIASAMIITAFSMPFLGALASLIPSTEERTGKIVPFFLASYIALLVGGPFVASYGEKLRKRKK